MHNIKVIGDGFWDYYLVGRSHRQNPEADAPLALVEQSLCFPGGALNVIENLKALGCRTSDSQVSTGPQKTRVIVDGKYTLRYDQFDKCPPISFLDPDSQDPQAIIISDYGKGALTGKLVEQLSITYQCPLFIDTKRDPLTMLAFLEARPGPVFFFPNDKEYKEWFGAYHALEHEEFATVVHKRGALGLRVGKHEFSSKCHNPVSVCGAGDTVIAAFVKSYLDTPNATQAAAYANYAAAVVCRKPYTATATPDEISKEYYGLINL